MKVPVLDMSGNKKEEIELPSVFNTPLREDVIKRAVLAEQSWRRQPYGADPMAGMRSSAHYHGLRDYRYTMMNREMARMARIHGSGYLSWRARVVPQAVKGRRAHPPKADKNWAQKINKKEFMLALKSAIAATTDINLVRNRGHVVSDRALPIIVDDSFKSLKKTKEVKDTLKKLNLGDELKRAAKKKIRAGRGKTRGRKYKKKKGILIVVDEEFKAAQNIPGIDVCLVENLTPEVLAPGTVPGRLTIFTKSAIQKIGELYG
ncbi:MAG: 50S ribosomal protein L4 [Candidatus Aenigmarchaeota archaeon ex4484_14]|nr:MAG: 50S ribosomal protein L4 [Candidatus Aenigmarchaeota archaeon ex4484_14]